ncbi:MAG: hypothetical protein K8E66_13265 [Phycisphaerales bacterium]|nr:hypothetical protein [Phycisphaerales bacterium]
MNRFCTVLYAGMLIAPAAQAANVGVDDSSAPWLGFVNVFELDNTFLWGSPWGVPDLVANFDDGAPSVTMSPNTIGDPDPYWYQGGGGPGAPGNKLMEANLYQEETGTMNGETVTFSGFVLSNTFTPAHDAKIFIRDFAADYSSVVEVFIDANEGAFSFSLDTIADAGRHVQWGFQVKGVNVWVTDTDPFGNAVFSSIPTPASIALLGLGGVVATRRRRFR